MSSSCSQPPLRKSRVPPGRNPPVSPLTLLGDECPKPREAEHLTLRIVGLYQTITVEEDALATIELYLLLLVTHPRHKPQRHPCGPKFVGIASTPQVGRLWPAFAYLKLPLCGSRMA